MKLKYFLDALPVLSNRIFRGDIFIFEVDISLELSVTVGTWKWNNYNWRRYCTFPYITAVVNPWA
jgi:hypothetical protein